MDEQLWGQFNNDKKNGKGTLYFASGNKYIGGWVDNQRAGQGVFTWSIGNRYEITCSEMFCHHLL